MVEEKMLCKLDIKCKLTTAFRIMAVIFWAATIIFMTATGFVRIDEYPMCEIPNHTQVHKDVYLFGMQIVSIWEHEIRVISAEPQQSIQVYGIDDVTGETVAIEIEEHVQESNSCYYGDGSYTEIFYNNIATAIAIVLIGFGFPVVLQLIYRFIAQRCSLTLTETQIYGTLKLPFSSQKLQMPIDKVDNVYTKTGIADAFRSGNTLAIRTASGVVKFHYVHNADEFTAAAMKQIEDAKAKTVTHSENNQELQPSNIEDLKKYKELLDSGVITQEEFDAKKKQLLGL